MEIIKVKVGDKVRSFDFHYRDIDGENACYVEGIVESIEGHPIGGGGKYAKFKITRKIFGGEEREETLGEYNWAPQNGQEDWTGKLTNHMEVIK
jgi:hypothetical protein|tara:strand:+ start:1367 stop:1648 length:282 start_codon:yes stop_codon:yes gene_type:complete